MLELGKFSKYLHIKEAKSINKTKINKVYVYGRYVRDLYKHLTKTKQGKVLKNKNEIYELVRNNIDNNHHFMFKGSNSTGLQEVVSNIKREKFMLYSLFTYLTETYSLFNVFKYLTVRTGLSMFTSMVIVFLIGPLIIKFFSSKKSITQ